MPDPVEQDVVILGVSRTEVLFRPLTSARALRRFRLSPTSSARVVVPGEIARVILSGRQPARAFQPLTGEIRDIRLDVAALHLPPLELEPLGDWDPGQEYWGEPGDRVEACLLPILSVGRRPAFAIQAVLAGDEPGEATADDPVDRAAALWNAGRKDDARAVLHRCLVADLRYLEAHAALGTFAFPTNPALALRHYTVGVAIADQAVPPDAPWVLHWDAESNRPFLRCLHGLGVTLWRLGRLPEARDVLDRLLWLNPTDHQGARYCLERIGAGEPWTDDEEG